MKTTKIVFMKEEVERYLNFPLRIQQKPFDDLMFTNLQTFHTQQNNSKIDMKLT